MSGDSVRKNIAVADYTGGFLFFSVSAGLIEIVVFALLERFTPWPYWPCYLIALVASTSNVPIAMLKVAIFYAVFTPVSTIFGNWLAEGCAWNEYLVTALNMIANFVLEYLYDRFLVFGKSIDTNERAHTEK